MIMVVLLRGIWFSVLIAYGCIVAHDLLNFVLLVALLQLACFCFFRPLSSSFSR
jgi:hypothetical protein